MDQPQNHLNILSPKFIPALGPFYLFISPSEMLPLSCSSLTCSFSNIQVLNHIFTTMLSDIVQETIHSLSPIPHGLIKDRDNYPNSSHHNMKLSHLVVQLFMFSLFLISKGLSSVYDTKLMPLNMHWTNKRNIKEVTCWSRGNTLFTARLKPYWMWPHTRLVAEKSEVPLPGG